MPDNERRCVKCRTTASVVQCDDGVYVCQYHALEYLRNKDREQEGHDARNQNTAQEEAK